MVQARINKGINNGMETKQSDNSEWKNKVILIRLS